MESDHTPAAFSPPTTQGDTNLTQPSAGEQPTSVEKPPLNKVANIVYTVFYTEGEGYDREWHIKQLIDLLTPLVAEERRQAKIELLKTLKATKLPWPDDVFRPVPEGEWEHIDEFAKTRGYRIDNISGELMRNGWKCLEREIDYYLTELRGENNE